MTGEGALPGPQGDVGEHALFPQCVQVCQDTVGVRGLVEQRDVHRTGAGARLAVLVHAHRHGSFTRHLQGIAWTDLAH